MKNDPIYHCKPVGVPRVGAPRQIIQTPKLMVFIYDNAGLTEAGRGGYRILPTDGRPHRTDVDPSGTSATQSGTGKETRLLST